METRRPSKIAKLLLRWSLPPVAVPFLLCFCMRFFTVKMEAVASSETPVNLHVKRCHIPEGSNPQDFSFSQPLHYRPALRSTHPLPIHVKNEFFFFFFGGGGVERNSRMWAELNVNLTTHLQPAFMFFFLFVTVCIQPVFHLSVYYGIFIVIFYKCGCTIVY